MEHGMDHNVQSGHNMMNIECDGSPNLYKMGSWKGHVLPGVLFIIWGSWWIYSVLSYLVWSKGRFRSRAWYPFPSIRALRFIEPFIKIILPPIAVSIELYFDHSDGFRYLLCPEGTMYAGRFALTHINNWQHTSIYPPIVLSGLIDILSTKITLPKGTAHAFLAFSFAVQSFVMGTHEKHQAQDAMVHWLLFVAMAICFVFVLLELHVPQNPLPALGRGAAGVLLGAWLAAIGAIEFEDHPQWSENYMGGAMIAPAYFAFIAFVILLSTVVLALFMAGMYRIGLVPLSMIPPHDDVDTDGPVLISYNKLNIKPHDQELNHLLYSQNPKSASYGKEHYHHGMTMFENDSACHSASVSTSMEEDEDNDHNDHNNSNSSNSPAGKVMHQHRRMNSLHIDASHDGQAVHHQWRSTSSDSVV